MILETEIAEFERRADELVEYHNGKYVVFHGHDMVGAFETFGAAAQDAAARFDRGPYLIRQVGARPMMVPLAFSYGPHVKPGLPDQRDHGDS